ncbi:type VI secretion system contractile sheath small subunit, partial [Vibrio parahaemolyticus]|nr:type VI secretion system contractile sheath small subunit [Vibrio parahaemolyticus]
LAKLAGELDLGKKAPSESTEGAE